jgi:hypothetical protein
MWRLCFLFLFLLIPTVFASEVTPLESSIKVAKEYLKTHTKDFPNQRYLVVIDYSQPSHVKRFHLLEIFSDKMTDYLVAHGKGSDPNFTGVASQFGDDSGSRKTPLGFFKTGKTYFGEHGLSLKLEGLSETNKNALSRKIVIHAAKYVSDSRKVLGRSWGCPALEPKFTKEVISKIKEGALVYSVN